MGRVPETVDEAKASRELADVVALVG